MSKAKSKPTGRIIDFNALLGNWPSINIGDQTIEGRHLDQTEKLAWAGAEANADGPEQRRVLAGFLNARGADVDPDWFNQFSDVFLVALVRGLHGLGWPGESPNE